MENCRMKRLWIIIFAILIFSCKDNDEPNNMVICASGNMKINIANDSTITGSWDIAAVNGFTEKDIGPQIGKGQLEGYIKYGEIQINMNPRIADYNIFLNGNYSNENIIGNWHLSLFRGQDDEVSGNFEINNENKYTAYINE